MTISIPVAMVLVGPRADRELRSSSRYPHFIESILRSFVKDAGIKFGQLQPAHTLHMLSHKLLIFAYQRTHLDERIVLGIVM